MKQTPWMVLAVGTLMLGACSPGVQPGIEEVTAQEEQEAQVELSPQVEWLSLWLDEKLELGEAQSGRVLTALRELELSLAAGRGEEVPPRQYTRISQDAWWTFEDSLRDGINVSRQRALRDLGGGLLAVRLVMELELTPEQAVQVAALTSELSEGTGQDSGGDRKKLKKGEMREIWDRFNESLGPLLTSEQIRRYQITERLLNETHRERFELAKDPDRKGGEKKKGQPE